MSRKQILALILAAASVYGGGYYTAYLTAREAFDPQKHMTRKDVATLGANIYRDAHTSLALGKTACIKAQTWYLDELKHKAILFREGVFERIEHIGAK